MGGANICGTSQLSPGYALTKRPRGGRRCPAGRQHGPSPAIDAGGLEETHLQLSSLEAPAPPTPITTQAEGQ